MPAPFLPVSDWLRESHAANEVKTVTGICRLIVRGEVSGAQGGAVAMENPLEFADTTRRDVLRKTVFIAPVVLTLPVIPAFAKAGSNVGHDQDEQGYQGHQGDANTS